MLYNIITNGTPDPHIPGQMMDALFYTAINNGQSRDTGNIEHKNAINYGQSRDTSNIEHK